ncbi:alpha/beta hydrolase domain-containing protein [Kutzneria sp. CA-103260]|uniref:alpha/beta hydrolase domain-containing protein n=1 Tax=Kutzneria sp. CA-103260 TaxID=2802641 RepID=UPI001BA73416|nr:alpha/beta hydrolase domain-containing protein [Kutzneria sp. CA-103260]
MEGPVTGGRRDQVFGGFFGDGLDKHGYVEEEYFVSGVAEMYRPVGELSADGKWRVVPDGHTDYRTRVVVHRPKDPAKFNGIVLCEWTNVSAFIDISNAVNERFYKSGFAYAAISAQKMGIEGLDRYPDTGLTRWDPERYGSLHIPGDGYSYDIFTQVARALASARSRTGADPLPGLDVRHCIATGESQSAARLATYINAVHPLAGFFSGFMPCVLVGGGSELHNPEIIPGESKEDYNRRFYSRIVNTTIRDDVEVPVLIVLSETEARMFRVQPQPDSAWLRVWEVAGTVHGSACDTGYRGDISARDGVVDPFSFGGSAQRMVRFMPIMEAAAVTMVDWIGGGAPLQRQPRLLRGTDPRAIVTDAHGNALGGVRMPEIAVPTATFETVSNPVSGVRKPFTQEQLRTLYPTDEHYVDAVRAAVDDCQMSGLLLPVCGQEYLADAEKGPRAQG